MARLTILAACVGAVPLFAFLVVVWLTGGAPLAPIGAAPATAPATFGQTPIIDSPAVAPAAPAIVAPAIAAPILTLDATR